MIRSHQLFKKRCKSLKGWKPELNNSREPDIGIYIYIYIHTHIYIDIYIYINHDNRQKLFDEIPPTCISTSSIKSLHI